MAHTFAHAIQQGGLKIAERNRAADLQAGQMFGERTKAFEQELLTSAASAVQNDSLDPDTRKLYQDYLNNPTAVDNVFKLGSSLFGKEQFISKLNDTGFVSAALGKSNLALGDYTENEDGSISPTLISRDYDRNQVIAAPFTQGGEKFAQGGSPQDIDINSLNRAYSSYSSRIKSNYGIDPLTNVATASLASPEFGGPLQPSALTASVIAGEKPEADLTEAELRAIEADPYVKNLFKQQNINSIDELGGVGTFNPGAMGSNVNRLSIEESATTGPVTSNRTTERRKPEEIRTENQRRAPLIELGDQVKDKLSDVRLSSLDDSAKSFYKEVGAIRTTNRRGDLTQNPTLPFGTGGVYKESTFVNVLNSSPTYLNEFNSDPQAFAAKYANDPEFKKNFPSRDTIVKNKAEALKVNDQPSLVEFLQKNVDKNTGAANVSYLSQRARFNLFYAALDSAPDELRKDDLFKQTLSNLVSYGIFNTAEPGTDPNKLTPSQQSSIVQATINNPEYKEPLAYFQSLSTASAGRLEDVVGSSEYREQQIRLYNYVDSLTSDAQLNAVLPAIDLDLALTAKGRSKKGFKGFVGSLIRGEAGYIAPDAPAPRFLTYVKTPKGPRMITTIEEVKALAEGDLVLDSIRLQPPRGFGTRGRYLRKSDFTNDQLKAVFLKSVATSREEGAPDPYQSE